MKIRSFIIAIAFVIMGAIAVAEAQNVVVISGKKYIIHNVVRGETLYALSRKYGVSIADLQSANPAELANGLKAGSRLKVPVKQQSTSSASAKPAAQQKPVEQPKPVEQQKPVEQPKPVEEVKPAEQPKPAEEVKPTEEVKPAEQPKQVEEVKPAEEAKPVEEVKPAEEVKPTEQPQQVVVEAAPVEEKKIESDSTSIQQVVVTEQTQPKAVGCETLRNLRPDEVAEVVMVLPLTENGAPRPAYVDFYRGFLLGLDSIRMEGYSVNMRLYNTNRDPNRVAELIASGELNNTHLVVGPIYEDEVIPMAMGLRGRGIAVVSPLATLQHTTGEAFFQMSPSPKGKYAKIEEQLKTSKVVIVSGTANDRRFDSEIRELLKDAPKVVEHKYVYEHPTVVAKKARERARANITAPGDFTPYLRGSEPTIFVITSSNVSEVDRILAALSSAKRTLQSRQQKVAPYMVLGNNRWRNSKSVDYASYFAHNVVLFTSYHTNRLHPVIKKFDKEFAQTYGLLPSRYAYRGYDAAMIFVKALYNSMDTGLESMQYMPLITPYEFNLNPETGIRENTPWVKVEYKKNHTIISK